MFSELRYWSLITGRKGGYTYLFDSGHNPPADISRNVIKVMAAITAGAYDNVCKIYGSRRRATLLLML